MPRFIGELSKPRVLVINFEENEAAARAVEQLAPTVRHIKHTELRHIRQRDWDAAIIFGDAPELEEHLYVLQFGGAWGGEVGIKGPQLNLTYHLLMLGASKSVQFIVPDDLIAKPCNVRRNTRRIEPRAS